MASSWDSLKALKRVSSLLKALGWDYPRALKKASGLLMAPN